MHDTAMLMGALFFRCYCRAGRVLDVGSMDVNGSLRSVAPPAIDYLGVDLAPGPGVDLVVERSKPLPFEDGSFDAVVSTSCLEHDPMFWVTFLEMARCVAPGGFVYVSAPQNGPYHGHPGDCWRFQADAGAALVAWADYCNMAIGLVEAFLQPPLKDIWTDNVMVFGRRPYVTPATLLGDLELGVA